MESIEPHPIKRILVPIDFSPCSREAVEYAALLAEHVGADVDLMHVWRPPRHAAPEDDPLARFARTEAAGEMRAFLTILEEHGITGARARLEAGSPAEIILELAAIHAYDLIVMGTHGRVGLHRLLAGSVAEKVVRGARCPVLTVRTPEETPAALRLPRPERPRTRVERARS